MSQRKSPDQYYFYAGPSIDPNEKDLGIETWVVMCPINFFEEHGYVYDQHLNIDSIIPDYMGEEAEAMFSSDKSPENTRRDLLALGFKESTEFTAWCSTHDPFLGSPEDFDF